MATVSNTVKVRVMSSQGILRTRIPRVSSQGPVQRSRVPRVSSSQGIKSLRKAKISSGELTKVVKARIKSTNVISKAILPRLRSPHADYADTIQTGNPASGDSITFQVWENGVLTTLDLAPNSCEITLRESAPGSWSIQMTDETGAYHPRYSSGDWYDVMTSKAFDADGDIVKKIIISGVWGGTPWRFVGIPTSFQDRQVGDKTAFTFDYTWSGTDISHVLFRPAQTMATVRSNRDSVVSARTALAQVTTEMGISANWSKVDTYPVRVQHRQNAKPMDWIKQILEIPVAEWRVEGEQIVGYQPKQEPSGSAHWTLDLTSQYVEEIDVTDEVYEVVNRVTVTRAQETGGAVTNEDGDLVEFNEQVDDFGDGFSVTFPSPYYGVVFRAIKQEDCKASDFIYRNEAGDVVAVQGVRAGTWPQALLRQGDNVKTCSFTVGSPGPGSLSTSGYCHIRWFGAPRDRKDDEAFDAVDDTTFTVTVSDTDSIQEHGLQPRELGPLSMCPNSTWATRHGQRWLAKNGRARRKRRFQIPFHPLIRPGETVKLVHPLTGTTACYLTEVQHSLDGYFPGWKTTLTAVEYL